MYEYLRLYAWMVLPVYLGWAFVSYYRKPEIAFIAPLCLVWLAGKASLLMHLDMPQWVSDGVIDALSAISFIGLSLVSIPRRPYLYIALSFILDTLIQAAYGGRDMAFGYSVVAHRLCYWTLFAIAWGQAVYAIKHGGGSRGKRWRLDYGFLDSVSSFGNSTHPRLAGAGLFRGAGE